MTAQSWRGLQLSQRVTAVPRTATDLALRPPSLVPGAVIGTLGLVSALAGGALFIVGYWGMDPLGLLRECGHPLLVAWIALTCVVAARELTDVPTPTLLTLMAGHGSRREVA